MSEGLAHWLILGRNCVIGMLMEAVITITIINYKQYGKNFSQCDGPGTVLSSKGNREKP